MNPPIDPPPSQHVGDALRCHYCAQPDRTTVVGHVVDEGSSDPSYQPLADYRAVYPVCAAHVGRIGEGFGLYGGKRSFVRLGDSLEPVKTGDPVAVLHEIAADMERDAITFDGAVFDGPTVAAYLGNLGAGIAALAEILARDIEGRRGRPSE